MTHEKVNRERVYEEVSKYKTKTKSKQKSDVDPEDRITYQNFLKIVILTLNQSQSEAEVKEAFKVFADENGMVNMFEIRYLLKNKCNREISDRDLQDFLAFNGVTGGKLSEGLINFEEILK